MAIPDRNDADDDTVPDMRGIVRTVKGMLAGLEALHVVLNPESVPCPDCWPIDEDGEPANGVPPWVEDGSVFCLTCGNAGFVLPGKNDSENGGEG